MKIIITVCTSLIKHNIENDRNELIAMYRFYVMQEDMSEWSVILVKVSYTLEQALKAWRGRRGIAVLFL
jgi:hypothetical protein